MHQTTQRTIAPAIALAGLRLTARTKARTTAPTTARTASNRQRHDTPRGRP